MNQSIHVSSTASSSRYNRDSRASTNSTLSASSTEQTSAKKLFKPIGLVLNTHNLKTPAIKKKKVSTSSSYLNFNKNSLNQVVDLEKLIWSFRQDVNRHINNPNQSLPSEILFKVLL